MVSCSHAAWEGGPGGERNSDGWRQPVSNDPGTSTTGRRCGHSKQRRWGASVWAPWHSAGRLGQTAFNRFEN
jgi:hypothetical protein